MANMIAKHGPGKWQCSCCDRGGKARRQSKKAAKAREDRQWRKEWDR
jgi:hypothetical protein